MSSSYLNSENMKMIERVLKGVRLKPMRAFAETPDARFLIAAFQQGMHQEIDLREALAEHREAQRSEEGGSLWLDALKLFRVLHRSKQSAAVMPALDSALRVDEIIRLREDDTDGTRRRQNEDKVRNQMH